MYMYTAELSNCYMTVCLGFHKVFDRCGLADSIEFLNFLQHCMQETLHFYSCTLSLFLQNCGLITQMYMFVLLVRLAGMLVTLYQKRKTEGSW